MTWETRDFPVLQAIVDLTEVGAGLIRPAQIAEHLDMDETAVQRALAALADEQPPFFSYSDERPLAGPREIDGIHSPTGHARRTVGSWPTAERLAKQIIAGLEAAAATEPDEEKRSRIKQTAAFLANSGWNVILGVAGNAVSKGIGL
ncbi:hypothetical protein AB0L05_27795 [Nonomuraea pusilla]|uniref:hypothetical protein n=1 Tax=Nonomuraea pusilla TaxID=46177 RepID=UPI00331D708D